MNQSKSLLLGVISTLLLLLLVVMFIWSPSAEPVKHHKHPLAVNPEPEGGDFTVEILNADMHLSDYLGKTVILYFGYTQCPDISPITLSIIADALKKLNAKEQDTVQAIFVSIDPERDNTARLEEYSAHFHPKLIAATAEAEVIATIAARYGVSYEFIETDLQPGPVINHSSGIYIINNTGELTNVLAYGVNADAILDAVRVLISE